MRDSLIRWASIFGLFFVFLFLYTRLAGPVPFNITSVTTTKSDTFNVTGEGTAVIKLELSIRAARSAASAGDAIAGRSLEAPSGQSYAVSGSDAADRG